MLLWLWIYLFRSVNKATWTYQNIDQFVVLNIANIYTTSYRFSVSSVRPTPILHKVCMDMAATDCYLNNHLYYAQTREQQVLPMTTTTHMNVARGNLFPFVLWHMPLIGLSHHSCFGDMLCKSICCICRVAVWGQCIKQFD
jgi:hypothetical protein